MSTNNVINQKQPIPYFNVNLTNTVSNVTGDGTQYTVLYDNINADTRSAYNPATGIWTCPQTGNYIFGIGIQLGTADISNAKETILGFSYNSNIYTVSDYSIYNMTNTITAFISTGSRAFSLTAGDTIFTIITISGTTKIIDITGGANTYFYGYLIS